MIRQGREEFYAQPIDLTKVEETRPDGMTGTLLAERDKEVVRLAHAYLADVTGCRKTAQDKVKNELIHKFMNAIFNKLVAKIEDEPFETFYVVSVSSSNEDLDFDIKNLYSLLRQSTLSTIINDINDRCEYLGVKIDDIKLETMGKGYYIPVTFRF